jgi:uncharacterized membrane protein YczE
VKVRPLWLRWLVLATAIVSVGLGIALMVTAHLGVAPADVLATGGSHRFGIGVGTMGWVVGGVMTIVAVSLRRRPQLGTVLGAFGVGQSVNWFLLVLPSTHAMAPRVGMLIAGLVVLYLAISFGIATELGTGPIELVMLGLADRGIQLQVARWGIEAGLLATGIALGGQFGVATIVFLLATGPVLARLLPPVSRLMGSTSASPSNTGTSVPAIG